MTVKQAAARLDLSAGVVYKLIAAGLIPHHRVGLKRGKVVLDPADVERYYQDGRREGGEPRMELRFLKLRA